MQSGKKQDILGIHTGKALRKNHVLIKELPEFGMMIESMENGKKAEKGL